MIGLWIGAALLSGLAALLIVLRSARAGAEAAMAAEDPAMAVYRRQLAEIDDLADRGLLAGEEQGSARTEAARRLLSASDSAEPRPPARPSRWLVTAVAATAPLLAAGLYIWLGSPGTPDQPFAKRLDAWGKQDPATLQPSQLVAILKGAEPKHPNDPTLFYFLARADMAAGDAFDAERNLHKAIDLAPNRPDLWSALGAFLASQSQGDEASPQALAAFAKAQSLDPDDIDALYYLSRAKIGAGDVAGGLAGWTRLLGELKPEDPRRAIMTAQIAEVQRTQRLPVDHPQQAQAGGPPAADQDQQAQQQAMIQGMVDKLAAQLNAQPDDPAGWARLVRSYGVLGDKAKQDAALARARDLFKNRPADLHTVEAALEPAQ